MNRIKTKDIPALRERKLAEQNGKCAICAVEITGDIKPCLDHDHQTGAIRDVLCNNCNGIEGKVFRLCRRMGRGKSPGWMLGLIDDYWLKHAEKFNSDPVFHPTHKTPDEKRLRRNKKARKARLSKKNKDA